MKGFKMDKGWKYLLYFDLILPALLFLLAWLIQSPKMSMLFHAYEIFLVNPIPDLKALTGIIGLLYHGGVLGYTLYKHNYKDFALCLSITLAVVVFFLFEINYRIPIPLDFAML